MTEYSSAKTGEYPRIFPNFQNCARCEKDLKDNKDNSRHLGRKYARIFVLGHYLFLVAHSFPRASLSENCSLLETDNVGGQICEHIFAPNGDYCLYSIHFLLAPVGLFFKPKYRAIYCTYFNFTAVVFPFLSSPWGSVYRFLYGIST